MALARELLAFGERKGPHRLGRPLELATQALLSRTLYGMCLATRNSIREVDHCLKVVNTHLVTLLQLNMVTNHSGNTVRCGLYTIFMCLLF